MLCGRVDGREGQWRQRGPQGWGEGEERGHAAQGPTLLFIVPSPSRDELGHPWRKQLVLWLMPVCQLALFLVWVHSSPLLKLARMRVL